MNTTLATILAVSTLAVAAAAGVETETEAGAVAGSDAAETAEDEKAGAEKTFETSINIGATLTDGNSETLAVSAGLVTEGEKEGIGSIRAGIEGGYGRDTVRETVTDADGISRERKRDETTSENISAFVHARRTLSRQTFAYVDVAALYDDIAAVDYRLTAGPGLGVYLRKSDTRIISLEAGVTYLREEVDNVFDDYATLRLAQRCEWRFGKNARIWQSAECLPELGDFENYLLTAEIGAEAALNTHLNLRLMLRDKYDSTPGEDLERNDLVLTAGVGIKL